jgi:hypothetical protein
LPGAGEVVEDSRLSRIGVACQGDGDLLGH